jgi:uncharacterized protein (DUF3820 family)
MIDGSDATMLVGKFTGSRISDLVKSSEGRQYVRWITKEDWPDDLKVICKVQLVRHENHVD